MTVRVRVSPAIPELGGPVEASGASVVRATKAAIRKLVGRCGNVELTRLDTHKWSAHAEGLGSYLVTESRSGPGHVRGSSRIVSVSLQPDEIAALDRVAAEAGSRSRAVAEAVMAYDVEARTK